MNLIIDIGNSSIKVAIYAEGKIIQHFKSDLTDINEIKQSLKIYNIEKAIICSVTNIPSELVQEFRSGDIPFIIMNGETPLPFGSDYETPGTLGMDRVAAIAGAYNFSGHKDVLVVDAGTAITYDQLTGGRYNGGTISPGLAIRFRALKEFTARLPLMSTTDAGEFPARNTGSAIATGVVDGLVFEINEYIRRFRKKGAEGVVFITGGDGEFLHQRIAEGVILRPGLVTDGLNFILNYNA